MTSSSNQPNFDLIKAIILLVLVLVSVSLFIYGICEHSITASYYAAMFTILTAVLGKAWTT